MFLSVRFKLFALLFTVLSSLSLFSLSDSKYNFSANKLNYSTQTEESVGNSKLQLEQTCFKSLINNQTIQLFQVEIEEEEEEDDDIYSLKKSSKLVEELCSFTFSGFRFPEKTNQRITNSIPFFDLNNKDQK